MIIENKRETMLNKILGKSNNKNMNLEDYTICEDTELNKYHVTISKNDGTTMKCTVKNLSRFLPDEKNE